MARRAEVQEYLQKMASRRMAGAALLIGAVLSMTTGYFTSHSGTSVIKARLQSTDLDLKYEKNLKDEKGRALPAAYLGGKKFDLTTTKRNQVLLIELTQSPGPGTSNRTRNPTVEVLETAKDEKTGQTGEKPVYAAMPDDPFVVEDGSGSNLSFRFHMTVKEPKKYGLLLRISDDIPPSGRQAQWGLLDLSVKAVRASALPFYWGGAIMFLIGMVCTWLGRV